MKRTLPTEIPELMDLFKKEILALVIVPTWDDEGRGPAKEARTKMLLGYLEKNHLSPYFTDVNLAGRPGGHSKVVYAPGKKSGQVRGLIDKEVGVLGSIDIEFDWGGCHRWDMAHAMTKLLEFSDLHSRFLFLVSEHAERLMKMMQIIFPDIPDRTGFTFTPGECFVLYPAARYIEVVRLPGWKF